MSAPLIALVDDDAALLATLRCALEAEGFVVHSAADGADGLALCERERVSLLITDVNMPRLDGFSLCRRIREAGHLHPILVLSSRDSEIDEALGLDLGADDYMTKPFSTRVLIARVRALLRRGSLESATEAPARDALLEREGLCIDLDRLRVSFRAVALEVTLTEVRLLETLMRRPGVVFSRERLLESVREDGVVVGTRLIDTYVARLRAKLRAVDPHAVMIETVVGAGYRFRDA